MGNAVVGTPKVNAKVDAFANSFEIGVNPFPAKDLRNALFEKTIGPLKQFSLSDWDYYKGLALLTGFVLAQVNKPWPKVLGTEVNEDTPIQDGWVFHPRYDAVVDSPDHGLQVWDYKTVSIPTRKTLLDDHLFRNWEAGKKREYLSDPQVNLYAWAKGVQSIVMFQLVKPGWIKKLKDSTPKSLGQRWLDFYIEQPSRAFYPITVPTLFTAEHKQKIGMKLSAVVDEMKDIRNGELMAYRNEWHCPGCPFHSVCWDGGDINDPVYFRDKEKAVPDGKYLSVSQLRTYQTCRTKWQHQYESWKEPVGKSKPWLEFGKAIHDCLEVYGNMINEVQAQEVAND